MFRPQPIFWVESGVVTMAGWIGLNLSKFYNRVYLLRNINESQSKYVKFD